MKNLMLITMILAVFSFSACGQKTNVPAKIKTAFDQKFPTAKKVKWEKENEKEWEAEFKMEGKDYSANFDANGNWLETEYEIEENEFPAAVQQTLDKEFSGYEIEEAECSEKANGKFYEFSIEKGETELEVLIAPDGTVIKKKVEEDDEDKD